MAINGLTFDERNNTAKNIGTLYSRLLTNGKIEGCGLTFTNNGITIGAGYFIAKGRFVQIPTAETISLQNMISSGFVRVRFRIDLVSTPSESTFTQGEFLYDYAGTDSFAALEQEDINGTGNIYEVDFARGTITGGNVTGVTDKYGTAQIIDDTSVKLTGDQTITGTKTFNADQRLSNGRRFYTGSGTARGIGENGPGVVGVFADTSLQVLNTTGAAFKPVLASAFTQSSSYRWKNNINPFSDEKARKLMDIELKTFTYKPEFNDDGGAVHMGVIAEQIVDLFPDAVTLDDEGLPSGVDYSKLVVPCIGMIQRQQNKIDALTALMVDKGLISQEEIDGL